MSEYRRGQEVEVTYRARVAEVFTGSLEGAATTLRLEPLDGSYASPPGGWVSPAVVNVKVIEPVIKPGMYWLEIPTAQQKHMGEYHTDSQEFHYRNSEGRWVDVGWGFPNSMKDLNGPMVYPEPGSPDLTSGS